MRVAEWPFKKAENLVAHRERKELTVLSQESLDELTLPRTWRDSSPFFGSSLSSVRSQCDTPRSSAAVSYAPEVRHASVTFDPEVHHASVTFDPRVSTAASHAPEAQHVSFAHHAEFFVAPARQVSFEPEAEFFDTLSFFGPGAGGVTSCSDAVMDYLEGPLAESFEFMFLPADDADDARA